MYYTRSLSNDVPECSAPLTAAPTAAASPQLLLLGDPRDRADALAALLEQAQVNGRRAALAGGAALQSAQALLDRFDGIDTLEALIAHGAGCQLALSLVCAGLRVARVVLIEPDAPTHAVTKPKAPQSANEPRVLALTSRLDPDEVTRDWPGARVVTLDGTARRVRGAVLAEPYVIATAIEFALNGRPPVF